MSLIIVATGQGTGENIIHYVWNHPFLDLLGCLRNQLFTPWLLSLLQIILPCCQAKLLQHQTDPQKSLLAMGKQGVKCQKSVKCEQKGRIICITGLSEPRHNDCHWILARLKHLYSELFPQSRVTHYFDRIDLQTLKVVELKHFYCNWAKGTENWLWENLD